MLDTPAVLFPDVKAWAIAYVASALEARPESYASGVTVRGRAPEAIPTRLVTIRDDGGTRASAVTKRAVLGINVWAANEEDAGRLAALVVALLEASAGAGPVVAHLTSTGPYEVVEASGRPRRYASVDLAVRGSAL